ncbi:MAG: Ribonuclease 3 [candidate division WS6 bacterium OLB20]|uniref:Ribonuclease 3 n=1 Tax=candidate division WS6 bacterium OLB20 TaxID=1617426 RepID=A0A136LY42_9BACT|nr:MAG: Ribonuclease 3 [candidate division WS6 bacterium OLB20]
MISEDDKVKLHNLERRIRVKFNSLDTLKQALIHRSYINEARESDLEHNEKLEFLGDAVLELLVTQKLYDDYPERNEGELTSFRAATVRTESLAETAAEIDLGDYIYMSNGEEATGGRSRPYILANTFEALIGAMYLDLGLEQTNTFLAQFLFTKIQVIVENRLDIDNKSKLQEVSQERLNITPVYEFVSATGPDHNKTFEMAIMIGDHSFGTGRGKSKQEAEQNAAEEALKHWDALVKKHFS